MPTTPRSLTLADARAIALAAQGLDRPRAPSGAPSQRALLSTIDRVGLLQLDAVNVLARAHCVPPFSRLGPYPLEALDHAAYGPGRRLFEYWGHAASLIPLAQQPLFRWRMEEAHHVRGWGSRIAREARAYVDDVLAEVRRRGPVRASEVPSPRGRTGGWWGWSDAKAALEWLFRAGLLTTAARPSFERVYDVPERVLPPEILGAPTPAVEDAHRALLALAARALGVATEDDLADYHRLRLGAARPRIAELVEAGELTPVRIEGVARPAFRARGARRPSALRGRALVSPFDPLVWYRPRAERLFGFHYRIGIYTPAAQRQHGYYALPFLQGDAISARVDLKADRRERALRVLVATLEPGHDAPRVAAALAAELGEVARWLELERVEIAARGALGDALRTRVGKKRRG